MMATIASARARQLGRADGTAVGIACGSFATRPRLSALGLPEGAALGDTGQVGQAYAVASGIIMRGEQLLLVQNRRRNGSLDWSTPGGVVDEGEQVLEALTREVVEETGLHVSAWSPLCYTVRATFESRDITLVAEIFAAEAVEGTIVIDDPDDIVIDARFVTLPEANELLDLSPQWVGDPLRHFLAADGLSAAPTWRYEVRGRGGESEVIVAQQPPEISTEG